jgi:hypothetical protein
MFFVAVLWIVIIDMIIVCKNALQGAWILPLSDAPYEKTAL